MYVQNGREVPEHTHTGKQKLTPHGYNTSFFFNKVVLIELKEIGYYMNAGDAQC